VTPGGRKARVLNSSISDHYSSLTVADHFAFFFIVLYCVFQPMPS